MITRAILTTQTLILSLHAYRPLLLREFQDALWRFAHVHLEFVVVITFLFHQEHAVDPGVACLCLKYWNLLGWRELAKYVLPGQSLRHDHSRGSCPHSAANVPHTSGLGRHDVRQFRRRMASRRLTVQFINTKHLSIVFYSPPAPMRRWQPGVFDAIAQLKMRKLLISFKLSKN
jgi:hypothetical protein